jgi:hypothetical protein
MNHGSCFTAFHKLAEQIEHVRVTSQSCLFVPFKLSNFCTIDTRKSAMKAKMYMLLMIVATTMATIFDNMHHLGPFQIQRFGNWIYFCHQA